MPKKASVNTGNAGEHLVMAELLHQGFHAFMADRNNPDYDISVYKNGKHSLLRVKTTSNGVLQYTAKKDEGVIFRNILKKHDFVVVVNFSNRNKSKEALGVRGADFYIVPTHVVNEALQKSHEHWHKFARRDGQTRKITSHRAIGLHGEETEGNIARGFDKKWKKYYEAWKQL